MMCQMLSKIPVLSYGSFPENKLQKLDFWGTNRVGKNRVTIVSTQNTEFITVLFLTVLFSILKKTVNLLLPHLVYESQQQLGKVNSETEFLH